MCCLIIRNFAGMKRNRFILLITSVHAKLPYIIKVITFSIFVFKSEASSYLFE